MILRNKTSSGLCFKSVSADVPFHGPTFAIGPFLGVLKHPQIKSRFLAFHAALASLLVAAGSEGLHAADFQLFEGDGFDTWTVEGKGFGGGPSAAEVAGMAREPKFGSSIPTPVAADGLQPITLVFPMRKPMRS